MPAIKENFFQREIADASFRYQSEVEAKQRIIVGVNRYQQREDTVSRSCGSTPRSRRSRSSGSPRCAARATRRRWRRRWQLSSAARKAMRTSLIVDASRAYVTMGEMRDTLREIWGVWRETPVF